MVLAWRHKFFCLAYTEQEKIPSSEIEKEELCQAGLGEKVIEFERIDMNQKEFRDVLVAYFPQLEGCGGFPLLKGIICTN